MQESNFRIQYDNDHNSREIHHIIEHTGLQKMSNLALPPFPSPLKSSLSKRNIIYQKNQKIRQIIYSQKIKKIGKSFIRNLRYNSTYRVPPLSHSKEESQNGSGLVFFLKSSLQIILQAQGLQLTDFCYVLWNFITLLEAFWMVIILCLIITFHQANETQVIRYIKGGGIVVNIGDLFLNLTVKRYANGKYLGRIQQIIHHYRKTYFLYLDIANLLFLAISEALDSSNLFLVMVLLSSILKFISSSKNFERVEFLLLTNTSRQHYFSLIKCIFTNFTIGHFISIALNLMTFLSSDQNWYYKIGIQKSEWFTKYIWGYYWGTNIMLTVGFGDISATNQFQAMTLVVVETISCITLAYNITCVGYLISSIKREEEQKNRKLKFFHRMCKENYIENSTQAKISNFIEGQFRIKKLYEEDKNNEILRQLPDRLQKQFKKGANTNLLKNIELSAFFLTRIFTCLAGNLNKRICHSEELIISKNTPEDFIILNKGILTFICDNGSKLDGVQMGNLSVLQGEKPKIVSLNFVRNKIPMYNVKSEGFSTIFTMEREKLFCVLRKYTCNYELLCELKDKYQSDPQQNNLYKCQICKEEYHNNFQCNRLHFIPLKRKVIFRFLSDLKKSKRKTFPRQEFHFKTLRDIQQIQTVQNSFLQNNVDSAQYIRIQNLVKFYEELESINEQTFSNTGQLKKEISQILRSTRSKENKLNNMLYEYSALKRFQQLIQNTRLAQNSQLEVQSDAANNFDVYFREWNPERIGGKKNRASFLGTPSDNKKQKNRKQLEG